MPTIGRHLFDHPFTLVHWDLHANFLAGCTQLLIHILNEVTGLLGHHVLNDLPGLQADVALDSE
jgi:hypothetical protein